ncbi:8981_t:CDS:2 [Gigaspora margarita]|uniref:8981_t:CDS:1 n=1 Tax=Gigaspora margarita TaxID=4874 RepID=A0ABN7UYI3_GIGMA|nr:8981_t:CDS:2 [Gigaspora margarita]
MQNITPLPENLDSSTSANAQNNDDNNCRLWWDKLENLRHYISSLRPLPPVLQNIYMSNFSTNFEHFSHQYNSLFSFTTIGYMGGVVNLQHPHAFTVNGHAYHQIHSANTEGYPINWFVYDADAQNNIVSQRGLDQDIVNQIKQELEAINPFIQANAEIAACMIVHSIAIMQEQCPTDDEYLQFIRKEQCRFQKGGQEEDESLGDKAELHSENIYLPASHTYSYRWSYKK